MTELRSKHDSENNARISPGGWHWSYVGSEGLSVEDRILKKLECAAHIECNTPDIRNNVSRVEDNKDPIGRDFATYEIVDVDENKALAQQYNVRSVPTTVIEENGVEIDRFVGGLPKQSVIQKLNG